MDAMVDAAIHEITILKSTQVGGSEAIRNMLGYIVDNDPGPTLLVLPDEKSAKNVLAHRIQPMFDSCPRLRSRMSSKAWDNTQYRIQTDGMSIDIGWSGSAQSLASREIRYLFFDEEDNFAVNDLGDPISQARERTRTYKHRARIIHNSTPSTRMGNIWRQWEASGDKRHWHCPCPHCGEYQAFTFPQLKWPKQEVKDSNKVAIADDILSNRRAWYECVHCKGRIEDRHKNTMLLNGVWLSEGQRIAADGTITGSRPASHRVGFALNCFLSPWITFSEVAYKFIMAFGDPAATLVFRNAWLAEPYEDIVVKPKASVITKKAITAPAPDIVPAWATSLIISVDTQKDFFYYAIRAWGFNWKSQLVHIGAVKSFDELATLFSASFKTSNGGMVKPNIMVIDSGGDKTEQVYQFAAKDSRIIAIKGSSHKMTKPYQISVLGSGVQLRMIDTGYYKDFLQRLIDERDSEQDGVKWQVYKDVEEAYCQQMASEQKVFDRRSQKLVWVPVNKSTANHFWDVEVYSVAAADMGNVGLIPAAPPPQQANQPQAVTSGNNWLGNSGGSWL